AGRHGDTGAAAGVVGHLDAQYPVRRHRRRPPGRHRAGVASAAPAHGLARHRRRLAAGTAPTSRPGRALHGHRSRYDLDHRPVPDPPLPPLPPPPPPPALTPPHHRTSPPT